MESCVSCVLGIRAEDGKMHYPEPQTFTSTYIGITLRKRLSDR